MDHRPTHEKAKTIKLPEDLGIQKDYLAHKNKYPKESKIYKLKFINILSFIIITRNIKNEKVNEQLEENIFDRFFYKYTPILKPSNTFIQEKSKPMSTKYFNSNICDNFILQ